MNRLTQYEVGTLTGNEAETLIRDKLADWDLEQIDTLGQCTMLKWIEAKRAGDEEETEAMEFAIRVLQAVRQERLDAGEEEPAHILERRNAACDAAGVPRGDGPLHIEVTHTGCIYTVAE